MEENSPSEELLLSLQSVRSHDNNMIQSSTRWLVDFLMSPSCFDYLFDLLSLTDDKITRQQIYLAFERAVSHHWANLPSNYKEVVFNRFIDLSATEKHWILKQSCVNLIHLAAIPEYYPKIIEVLKTSLDKGDDTSLEVALMLAPLIHIPEYTTNSDFLQLRSNLLEAGINSQSPNVLIASMHYGLISPSINDSYFDARVQYMWTKCIEVLGPYLDDPRFSLRVVKLVTYSLQDDRFNLNPLPLIERLIDFIQTDGIPITTVIQVCRIFECICINYGSLLIEHGFVRSIFLIFTVVSNVYYFSDDSLSITLANLFEAAFSSLFSTDTMVQMLVEMLDNLSSTPANLFVKLRSIAAVLPTCTSCLSPYVGDICNLITSSILQDGLLLCESACDTAATLATVFPEDCRIHKSTLVEQVLQAVAIFPSLDTISSFTKLAEIIHVPLNVSLAGCEIFGRLLSSDSVEVQAPSARAIVALNAPPEVVSSVLMPHLNSDNPATVSIAVDSLSKVISQQPLSEDVDILLNFISTHAVEETVVFTALDRLSVDHVTPLFESLFLPLLVERASDDFSMMYRTILADHIDSDSSYEEESEEQFSTRAHALHALGNVIRGSAAAKDTYYRHVLQCCRIQASSAHIMCRIAAAETVCQLAEALVPLSEDRTEPTEMAHVALATAMADDDPRGIISGLRAASEIVRWYEYGSLGGAFKPLLDFACNLLNKISSKDVSSVSDRGITEAVTEFLCLVVSSADDKALQFMSAAFDAYKKLAEHSDAVFRSLALRFFIEIIDVSNNAIETDFKRGVLQLAISLCEEGIDEHPYVCIRIFAQLEPEIISENLESIFNLFISKSWANADLSEKLTKMKDNYISSFSVMIMRFFRYSASPRDYGPVFLKALPQTKYFDFSDSISEAMITIYEETTPEFDDLFKQFYTKIFMSNNLTDIITTMCIKTHEKMKNILSNIYGDSAPLDAPEYVIKNCERFLGESGGLLTNLFPKN